MAAMTSKKTEFLRQCVAYAEKAETLTRDIKELQDYYADNALGVGLANAITQPDIDAGGGEVAHLTPTIVAAYITAIANVALTPGQRSTMRQVSGSSVPHAQR